MVTTIAIQLVDKSLEKGEIMTERTVTHEHECYRHRVNHVHIPKKYAIYEAGRKSVRRTGILYQPALIGTHFTGIILAQGKARFAP